MERVRKALLVFVFVLSTALGKDLHTKEFARHVEAVTETVITRLLHQMKHRYKLKENHPNAVKRLMENLKLRLKKHVQRRKPHRKAKRKNTTEKVKHTQ